MRAYVHAYVHGWVHTCVCACAHVHGRTYMHIVYTPFTYLLSHLYLPAKTLMGPSFVEIDHEIFSMVILSLPLIQEGQLSVSGERMCTILVNCLED